MHALAALGALGLPLVIAWNSRRREALAKGLTPIALVALSTAVVMGVAALLFLLRARPRPFTGAVVGLFPAALGVLPLLSVAYAALYAWQLGAWRPGPAVAGLAVGGVAAVFASIAAWSNNPGMGVRLAHFVPASLVASGVAVMIRFAGQEEARMGARLAFVGALVQAGTGVWALFSIPDLPHGLVLVTPLAAAGGLLLILGALAFGPRITRFSAAAAAAGLFFVVLSMSALREGARSIFPKALVVGAKPAERIVGLPGMENFARIAPGIFRSAQPRPEAWPVLKKLGVKTVINLRSDSSDAPLAMREGIEFVHLPLHANMSGSTAPTEEAIRKFFEIVLDPRRQPVLFHCAQGKDRTGTMAALYRIEVDGWTTEQAIEEMNEFGYHVIYRDLLDFVKKYRSRGFQPK